MPGIAEQTPNRARGFKAPEATFSQEAEAMSVSKRLRDLLDKEKVSYKVEEHDVAYTAQEVAALTHIRGKEMVKCVVVVADGKHILVALPSTRHLDLKALKTLLGVKSVRLAEEKEFATEFTDCELGAMPPFGGLYDIELYAEDLLKGDDEVAYNAGSHREVVRMHRADWERIAKPRYGNVTRPLA